MIRRLLSKFKSILLLLKVEKSKYQPTVIWQGKKKHQLNKKSPNTNNNNNKSPPRIPTKPN